MAKPGIGSKFVSVNLNESYGQHSHVPASSSYGFNRARSGSHGSGGGMVVLSRPRSSQKSGAKLSVPPPLNLPSLRKEHERFDSHGPGGGLTNGGSSGISSRPTSSGVGWTKPGVITLQEKGGPSEDLLNGKSGGESNGTEDVPAGVYYSRVDGVNKVGGSYMPPSARTGPALLLSVEKPLVLRGEDFPSLKASIPSVSGAKSKQKDNLEQKVKHGVDEKPPYEHKGNSKLASFSDKHLPVQSTECSAGSLVNKTVAVYHDLHSHHVMEKIQNPEYVPGPLVPFNPRSDWADDERDTSRSLSNRVNDHAYTRGDAHWDTVCANPRESLLRQNSTENVVTRWGQRDFETGKALRGEIRQDYGNGIRNTNRGGLEGDSWRFPHAQNGGSNLQIVANSKTGAYTGPSLNLKSSKDNYISDNSRVLDGRTDVGHGQGGRQQWHQNAESQGNLWGEKRYSREQDSRYNGITSFSGNVNSPSIIDPILDFAKKRYPFTKIEKPYHEGSYLKELSYADFDGQDPFSSGRAGMALKKRDLPNQADLHDPIRESFEAELEKVQKLQEQERQRVIDEQERAIEQARREVEEKTRLVREQEERRIRIEEEAREAVWRSEQERLETMQRVEEQRIAREEEKRRYAMEEERRKQAAQQKLLELEERIKKRQQVEEAKSDIVSVENASGLANEKHISKTVDMGHWEAGERIVERITASASSDSSTTSRPFEMGSSRQSGVGSYSRLDRAKAVSLWRRDVFENSSRQIPSFCGGAISRKDVNCGGEFMSNSHMDDFSQLTEQRWKLSENGEQYDRNTHKDPVFHQNFVENSIDSGWGGDHSLGNAYSSNPEEPYHKSDAVPPYSFNRSRYSLRQPRVLPPPSLSSIPKMSLQVENQHPGSSALTDSEMKFNFPLRGESLMQTDFSSDCPEPHEHTDMVDVHQKNIAQGENYILDGITTPGCDSQSSLSVSSPPHLSHGDLDELGDSLTLSGVTEGKHVSVVGNPPAPLIAQAKIGKRIRTSSSISTGEDEDWTINNNEQLQEPEEYDEDEDGYREEDEGHEGNEENVDRTQRFEDFHFERGSDSMTDNMVLGFDDGVEVGLPSDEFVATPRKEDSVFVEPQVSVDTLELQAPSVETSFDKPSKRVKETEKSINGEVSELPNPPQISTESDILGPVDLYSSAVHSTNTGSHSSSDHTVLPAASSSPTQAGVPLKQFGLFSGPSLTPSPVPAIQIGSIQMPLHLHPQIGPSFSHIHPSQPIFQFGQLRYTSPISQGILPLASQSAPCVQTDVPSHYALNWKPSAAYGQPGQHTSTPIYSTAEVIASRNIVPGHMDLTKEKVSEEENAMPVKNHRENSVLSQQGQSENLRTGRHNVRSGSESLMRNKRHGDGIEAGSIPYKHNFRIQSKDKHLSSMAMTRESALPGSKAQHLMFGNNTRKFFNVRNSGSRSSYMAPETFHTGRGGFQRRPWRNVVRTEFRIRENQDTRQSSNHPGFYGKSDLSGPNESCMLNKSHINRDFSTSLEMHPVNRAVKGVGRETLNGESFSHPEDFKLNKTLSSEDIDTSLQSGIVRVFEQPGIDVPSDADDFIEVRSKRQMLNERRERLEKESKAKYRASKMPQKPRPTFQNGEVSTSSSKIPSSGIVLTKNVGLVDTKISAGFNNAIVSQPLAPIGTPPVNLDIHADMKSQTSKPLQRSLLGSKSLAPTSLGCWDNVGTTQQVIPLTQSQLDEAMKPAPFETCVVSIGDHSVSVTEPIMSSSSIQKDSKSFSSSASPINSLLAGEKIQFGAVTSPTILPPSSRVVLHAIGPPISTHSHIQISKTPPGLSVSDSNQLNDSCVRLGDSDAEAEAAASAVAVAAISNDEIVSKNGVMTASVGGGDDFLSAALPADLSIETPPISLWPPPLLSPHTSSSHVPSHFPFYDINPLLGGPIYAFGSHEESAGVAHSQPIKSIVTSSPGPLGPWHQHHSGMDPFYGPAAGFAGPFVAPPGGISGIQQGPPHMVVYNHFAPVGQFGQVGLSFMGTTYFPSGKQPDWNLHSADVDLKGINNRPSAQCNPQNTLPPIQHLVAGPPVLPMQQSPLPVFDMSPFQTPDMAAQAGWPNLSVPQLPKIPPSAITSSSGGFSGAKESQFPEELGLVEPAKEEGSSQNPGAAENSKTAGRNSDLKTDSKKNVCGRSGGEWCYHRRMGSEKGLPPHTRVKQVYVAKQGNGTACSRSLG